MPQEGCPDSFQGKGRDRGGNLILYQRAQRLMDIGCEDFPAIVVATDDQTSLAVTDIPPLPQRKASTTVIYEHSQRFSEGWEY